MPEPMELAYEERGSGPVLLFVHGFPLDRTMWIPQLAGLAKNRTCVAVDLRGHGLSEVEKAEDFTMDLFADDIARTLDSMNVDQVDLCGMSMGGYVVFAFWRKYKERVRSLVFVSTKAEADTEEGKAGREKTADLVSAQGLGALYEQLGPKMFGPAASDDLKEKWRAIFESVAPEVAAADAFAMRDRPDSTPDLAGIDVPVLWIHGEEDALMPVDGARATAEKIPGARFVAVPKGGHAVCSEDPDAVNAALAEFLPKKK